MGEFDTWVREAPGLQLDRVVGRLSLFTGGLKHGNTGSGIGTRRTAAEQ